MHVRLRWKLTVGCVHDSQAAATYYCAYFRSFRPTVQHAQLLILRQNHSYRCFLGAGLYVPRVVASEISAERDERIVHLHLRCDEHLRNLGLEVGCPLDLARRAVDAFTRIMGMFLMSPIQRSRSHASTLCL
jgi:hypothetical protein